jgi:hypothetical protein
MLFRNRYAGCRNVVMATLRDPKGKAEAVCNESSCCLHCRYRMGNSKSLSLFIFMDSVSLIESYPIGLKVTLFKAQTEN